MPRFSLVSCSPVVALSLLLVISVFLLHRQSRQLAETRAELTETTLARDESARQLRELEHRAADMEQGLAIAQKQTPQAASATSPLHPPQRLTHGHVDARFKRAKDLAKAGQSEEALAEFLWCYDEGMVLVSAFDGVRGSYLLGEIARLGEKYPLALDALRVRRDQLFDAILADPDDSAAFLDFASINGALKEDALNLALFEKLPSGDARRRMLGLQVYETLAQTKRYAEALEAHSYRDMTSLFEALIEEQDLTSLPDDKIAQIRAHNRASGIKAAARDLEVLVGAGKLDQAQLFAAQVLAYDDTPATRQLIQDAAARAGRPGFFSP